MMQGSLARTLRVLRAERGWTLREASSRTGVTKETLSDLERGLRHPHDPTLAKIAKGYGVPFEELLVEGPALVGKAEASDTGQPGEEPTAREIARAEARRQSEIDRKAGNRTLSSEGIDHATYISDPYDPAVYDVLRRQPSGELAGSLLDAERDIVDLKNENAYQALQLDQLKRDYTLLELENAELKAASEREDAHR